MRNLLCRILRCAQDAPEESHPSVQKLPVFKDLPDGIKELPANTCKPGSYGVETHEWSVWSEPYKKWADSSYFYQARRCLKCNKVEERIS